MLDEQKMLQMIASEPLILAVRLADKFDCDLDDVETALLPHLNRRVFVREVMAPNGRKAPAYVLSDEYRAEVLAGQGARDPDVERRAAIREATPGVNMDIAGARAQKSAPFPVPTKAGTEPRITKWKAAVSYLESVPGNRCTQKEMCAALGLPLSSHPFAYLSRAVREGRLARDRNGDWLLGDGKPPAAAPLDSVIAIGNIIVASKDASPIPQAVADAVAAAPGEAALSVAVAPIAMAPTFRCGLWSDGVLEICRDGRVIAALSPDEIAQVTEFLKRAA